MGAGNSPFAAVAIAGDLADSLTATGTTQTDALGLSAVFNIVGTTASSTGVRLMTSEPACQVVVKNLGANTLNVYPATGQTINALSANAAYTISAGASATFLGRATGGWVNV
jgi:hypothetical protein